MSGRKTAMLLAGISATVFGAVSSPLTSQADSSTSTLSLNAPPPPAVAAQSVLLMDAANGQILYSKNADAQRAPASTTKLMSMYLIEQAVQEHKANWTDIVPVTPDAYHVAVEAGVSDAYLDPREHFTLEDMMKFIAVVSANDATIAVADKLAGDQQAFVDQMNAEAQALGLTGTHYSNPDGLPAADHYTTARDLATLARDLITKYPEVLTYTSIPEITIRKGMKPDPNTDEMLSGPYQYPGLDGLKTGFTNDAGYCFVGTAEQGGRRLISVVLGDTSLHQRFVDTAKLFDYGFNDFKQAIPVHQGQAWSQAISVTNGKQSTVQGQAAQDLVIDLPVGIHGTVNLLSNPVTAPVSKGQQVGELQYVVNNQVVSTTPLVAAVSDGKANWFVRLFRAIGHWFSHLLHKL